MKTVTRRADLSAHVTPASDRIYITARDGTEPQGEADMQKIAFQLLPKAQD